MIINEKLQKLLCTDCDLNNFGKGCTKECITDCALIEIERLTKSLEWQVTYTQMLERRK